MDFKKLFLVFLLLFASNFLFSKNLIEFDSVDYSRTGDYFPYVELSDEDSIFFPVTYEIELHVADIYDLDINNNFFTSYIIAGAYLDYDSIFETKNGDVIPLYPYDYIELELKEGMDTQNSNWYYWGYDDDEKYKKYSYEYNIKNTFYHKWNLREYPFDKQILEVNFLSYRDTSFIELIPSNSFPPSFNEEMDNLKDGYKVISIKPKITYFETPYEAEFDPGTIRKEIGTKLSYEIVVDRSGSYLFIKLFGGSFMAFLISWLAFFIPPKEFESRISINLGAIFGAIGNRYFVDSAMSSIQVITKADTISNLCILLLIFNIIIIIIQRNDKITWTFFEKSTNALIFSASLFIFLTLLIIFW